MKKTTFGYPMDIVKRTISMELFCKKKIIVDLNINSNILKKDNKMNPDTHNDYTPEVPEVPEVPQPTRKRGRPLAWEKKEKVEPVKKKVGRPVGPPTAYQIERAAREGLPDPHMVKWRGRNTPEEKAKALQISKEWYHKKRLRILEERINNPPPPKERKPRTVLVSQTTKKVIPLEQKLVFCGICHTCFVQGQSHASSQTHQTKLQQLIDSLNTTTVFQVPPQTPSPSPPSHQDLRHAN
jgi:hypothetical protein